MCAILCHRGLHINVNNNNDNNVAGLIDLLFKVALQLLCHTSRSLTSAFL